jgi:hypothetical protein
MKFNQGAANEVTKWVLFVMFFPLIGGMFIALAVVMILERMYIVAIFALAFTVFWCWMCAVGFYHMSAVTLSEEGVYLRVLIKKKFYPWKDIAQAGVLWFRYRSILHRELVLIPKDGYPYKPEDKSFRRRNMFHMIHLPCTQEVLSYLETYHGALDFDLTNSKGD